MRSKAKNIWKAEEYKEKTGCSLLTALLVIREEEKEEGETVLRKQLKKV